MRWADPLWAASGIYVKEISIHHIEKYGAVSIGRLESLAPSLRNFDAAFANLKVLKLNLRDWRYPGTGFELEGNRAPFIIRFLAKARNVRHMELSCYSSLEDDLFGEMARHCTFLLLETCKLSLFRLHNAVDLTTFLNASSLTLKSLHLSNISLRENQLMWPDILRRLASSENILKGLETLELVNLFTTTGSRIYFDGTGTPTRLTFGVEGCQGVWREEVLSRAHDFVEGSSPLKWILIAHSYPFVGTWRTSPLRKPSEPTVSGNSMPDRS
jgi:hypothetical protein